MRQEQDVTLAGVTSVEWTATKHSSTFIVIVVTRLDVFATKCRECVL